MQEIRGSNLGMRTRKQAHLRRILVPVDGSDNSKRAAELAIYLAKNNGAELVVLNVVPNPIFLAAMAPGPSAPLVDFNAYYESAESNASEWIDEIKQLADEEGVQVTKDIVHPSASIVESIVSTAEAMKSDLIVIGTRGLGGFKRLILGSVSGGVVAHAHCNVLVVR